MFQKALSARGCFQSANASASQQLIRTRYVQGPSTSEELGNRFLVLLILQNIR
jgi:hypothetical protein